MDALITKGAALVDVRPIEDFAAGHLPGALSIELRPVSASWLGWLVEPDRPLVFVLNADQNRAELVRQCLNVGYENLAGELDGGMDASRAAGIAEERIELVDLSAIASTVIDVRQDNEYLAGHLPDAINIELGQMHRAASTLPDGPVTVMCGHGERAMTAASILSAHGHTAVSVLAGGPEDWARATGRSLE